MRGSDVSGNPDGWGVAYMDDADAQLIREPAPAATSPYVAFLESYGPASKLIISHVRRATATDRSLANTQPFARILSGRVHVFAHNGYVPLPEPNYSSPWLNPVGDTDSEQLFCELLHDLAPLWHESVFPSIEDRTKVVKRFARSMSELGAMNFLYTDGLTLFAHSHRQTLPGRAVSTEPGLFVLQRSELAQDSDNTLCSGINNSEKCGQVTLVATVPLDDQPWRPMFSGELLRIENGYVV